MRRKTKAGVTRPRAPLQSEREWEEVKGGQNAHSGDLYGGLSGVRDGAAHPAVFLFQLPG